MKHSEQVVIMRWIPTLKEYERTKSKITPRPFKFIKNLCEAHHISRKELYRYYRKWVEDGKIPESLLPMQRPRKSSNAMRSKHPVNLPTLI